jgi:PucR family transcriptional regulator, purine catabolism regulatory protein
VKQPNRGHLGPLVEALRADRARAAYYVGLLEPLRRYDREHNGDLVRTLAAYLEWGGNAMRAAESLFLHRNSLRYRLVRIRALLGMDPDDPDARLSLGVALLLESDREGEPG